MPHKVDSFQKEMVEELGKLIAIPSVSDDLPEVTRALRHVLALAEKLGMNAKSVLDERVGVIELGQGDETLGILVHIDVVPPGNPDGWDSEPFKLDVRDGYLYGRGVIDDKGPIIQTLYAMHTLVGRQAEMKKKVQVIIGTQEEVCWDEIEEYTRTFPMPDYGYTPDGKFPMNNIEKGYTDIEVDIPVAGSGILSFEAGVSVNSIPDSATVVLKGDLEKLQAALAGYALQADEHIALAADGGNVKMDVQTVTAHASLPAQGINAISTACKFLKHAGIADNMVEFVCEASADDYYGKAFGLYRESEYYNGEFIDRTVINPTLCAAQGDGVRRVTYNARPTVGITRQDIEAGFEAFRGKYGFTFAFTSFYDALYVPKDKPFLQLMAQSYNELSGHQNDFILAHGTSYAKAMKNVLAWGPKLPGDKDAAHMANELLPVETFYTGARVYARALELIAFEERPLK